MFICVSVEVAGAVRAATADRAGLGHSGGGGRVLAAELVKSTTRVISYIIQFPSHGLPVNVARVVADIEHRNTSLSR